MKTVSKLLSMRDRSLDPNILLQALKFAVLGEYQADLERILKVIHLDHVTTCCGESWSALPFAPHLPRCQRPDTASWTVERPIWQQLSDSNATGSARLFQDLQLEDPVLVMALIWPVRAVMGGVAPLKS